MSFVFVPLGMFDLLGIYLSSSGTLLPHRALLLGSAAHGLRCHPDRAGHCSESGSLPVAACDSGGHLMFQQDWHFGCWI